MGGSVRRYREEEGPLGKQGGGSLQGEKQAWLQGMGLGEGDLQEQGQGAIPHQILTLP